MDVDATPGHDPVHRREVETAHDAATTEMLEQATRAAALRS
jgi:hypothetical protein